MIRPSRTIPSGLAALAALLALAVLAALLALGAAPAADARAPRSAAASVAHLRRSAPRAPVRHLPRSAPRAPVRHVPRGFLGVVAGGELLGNAVPFGRQVPLMARSGVESVGLEFNWALAQPYAAAADVPPAERSRYVLVDGVPTDFSTTDATVAGAVSAGLRVMPVLIQAPPWARLHRERTFSPPADPAQFARFAAAMVARYGSSGSFWTAHPRLRRLPIIAWQVWNEPTGGLHDQGGSVFWADDQPFAPRYTALLHAAHDAIKAADPHAQVLMGGLVGLSWEAIQHVYDAGARPYFDVVALHPYTAEPRNVLKVLRLVRAAMARAGDAAKPVAVTELGWPAFDGPSVARAGNRRIAASEAQWLDHTFNLLLAQRTALRIQNILWFTWLGTDSSASDAFDYAGLVHVDRFGRITAKPALAAYINLARRLEGTCRARPRGDRRRGCA